MTDSAGDFVREIHGDLARKYRRHATAIETAWRSLDRPDRIRCMKDGAMDGAVLRDPSDISLGNVYKIMPEWNLRDVTAPNSDYLLEMLKFRATTSLFQQYRAGPDGEISRGDRAIIEESMAKRNLRLVDPYTDCYTFFFGAEEGSRSSDMYGKSFHIKKEKEATMAEFGPAIQAGLCLPQSVGELILQRQIHLLSCLNIMIDDILDIGSKTRDRSEIPKRRPQGQGTAALSNLENLSLQESLARTITLADAGCDANERRDAHQEFTSLLSTEPVVLAHALNIWFFSRPELVPDEKGRRLPAITDTYISPALFEAVHNTVRGAAIWTYIARLVNMLKETAAVASKDKTARNILLQELANVCFFEYERCNGLFRRFVQTRPGTSHFKRINNAFDKSGNAKVVFKTRPEEKRLDTQLYWTLRLCEPEMDPTKAAEYLRQLSAFHQAYPEERDAFPERETESLFDLAFIVSFIQDLSAIFKLPVVSRKKGRAFISGSEQTFDELHALRNDIDLRDFAAPIDHLLEPGMAEAALNALDAFLREKTDASLGQKYWNLVEESVDDAATQIGQEKAAKAINKSQPSQPSTFAGQQPPPSEVISSERRVKHKTRPPHSSAFSLLSSEEEADEARDSAEDGNQAQEKLKVSPAGLATFSTLFARSRESRGFVNWTAFESSMGELGFSVFPKFGSVYTFNPPADMGAQRSVTLHRPHQSRIEGRLLLIFSRRLNRAYGWNDQTFEVSE